eukprot:2651518-Amphidinium_carterae.1
MKERLFDVSDATRLHVCDTCGLFAIAKLSQGLRPTEPNWQPARGGSPPAVPSPQDDGVHSMLCAAARSGDPQKPSSEQEHYSGCLLQFLLEYARAHE